MMCVIIIRVSNWACYFVEHFELERKINIKKQECLSALCRALFWVILIIVLLSVTWWNAPKKFWLGGMGVKYVKSNLHRSKISFDSGVTWWNAPMKFFLGGGWVGVGWVKYVKSHLHRSKISFNTGQGGHILAKMKFPVFSLSFPCVTKNFPVLFLRKTTN